MDLREIQELFSCCLLSQQKTLGYRQQHLRIPGSQEYYNTTQNAARIRNKQFYPALISFVQRRENFFFVSSVHLFPAGCPQNPRDQTVSFLSPRRIKQQRVFAYKMNTNRLP